MFETAAAGRGSSVRLGQVHRMLCATWRSTQRRPRLRFARESPPGDARYGSTTAPVFDATALPAPLEMPAGPHFVRCPPRGSPPWGSGRGRRLICSSRVLLREFCDRRFSTADRRAADDGGSSREPAPGRAAFRASSSLRCSGRAHPTRIAFECASRRRRAERYRCPAAPQRRAGMKRRARWSAPSCRRKEGDPRSVSVEVGKILASKAADAVLCALSSKLPTTHEAALPLRERAIAATFASRSFSTHDLHPHLTPTRPR